MPLPRNPRPKRLAKGSRSSRRRAHANTWLTTKIIERFDALAAQVEERKKHTYRGAYGVISYFMPGEPIPAGYQKVEYDENGREIGRPAQEKAPGLATEGFSSFFHEKEGTSG
jgi:hypothetical protein